MVASEGLEGARGAIRMRRRATRGGGENPLPPRSFRQASLVPSKSGDPK